MTAYSGEEVTRVDIVETTAEETAMITDGEYIGEINADAVEVDWR